MSLQTGMKLEDYIRKSSSTYQSTTVSRIKKSTDEASGSHFSGILSTFEKPAPSVDRKVFKGMSVMDYLTRPVASKVQRQSKEIDISEKQSQESVLPQNLDTTKVSFPQHPESTRSKSIKVENQSVSTASKVTQKVDTNIPAPGNTSLEKNFSSGKPHIDNAINEIAEKYGLPADLIHSMVQVESNYKANAVSQDGAQGLMQLMPGTAKEMGVTHPFDVRQNIEGGTRYMKKMLKMFNGNLKKALAAYNAGPAAVKRHHGNVPYAETKSYVKRVMNMNSEKI